MFGKLFDVFSRRERDLTNVEIEPLTEEFRSRVLMLLRDTLQQDFSPFLRGLHQKAAYLYGKFGLSSASAHAAPEDDLLEFFYTCSDQSFLDLIELMFRSGLPGVTWPENSLITGINEFFRVDALPYHLTAYSIEEYESSLHGTPTMAMRISEYPKIIRKDSEVVHKTAMEPALTLLNAEQFSHANDEFLKALEDHRKGDYGDCLTKCGSSFESVMKVLCAKNSVPFSEKDSASALLKALLKNGHLDQYWEQPLILISTLRNRLSSSHGAGIRPKIIPEHVATYAVNSTASAILFLCGEFG